MTAITPIKITYRASSGAAGSPASMLTGQIAYNSADGFFYVGFGDNGSGVATSIKPFAQHDFSINKLLPAGGTTGQILTKTASGDFAVSWSAAPLQYSQGNGITISSAMIAIDPSVVATVTALSNGLATKAPLSHTHDAADIVTGTLATACIPALDASKIASGVLDPARIPVLPSQAVQVSSGDLTALTTAQQTAIVQGTVVTTQDGSRYVYNGTGDKTIVASYVILADITPDWSVISNKPIFSTVATTGSYTDLSNRPTISTMAAQAASGVAITGGTMSGVTLTNCVIDGGTF